MDKALWITSLNDSAIGKLIANAQASGASTAVIRTTSESFPGAISAFNKAGIKVYGWRWPAVIDQPTEAPHYFALKEAQYVVDTLIPAGLAGYIADPESDHPGQVNDWNDVKHAALAQQFCDTIKAAAPKDFFFGVTSGCEYPRTMPNIPWHVFVGASDAVFPQTYWKMDQDGKIIPIHGFTPAKAYEKGTQAWAKVSMGKPIVAIGGELACVTAEEIADFGAIIKGKQSVAHFFSDSVTIPGEIHAAINSITS